MTRFHLTILLFGVAIDVTGTYSPAERATHDYPGCGYEICVNTYRIGNMDVSNLISTADWYEEVDRAVLKHFEP